MNDNWDVLEVAMLLAMGLVWWLVITLMIMDEGVA